MSISRKMFADPRECSRCHEMRPRTEFRKDPCILDGLSVRCRACDVIVVTEAKQKNQAHYTAYARSVPKEKARAWAAVHAAIKKGVLVRQACEVCGEQKTDAHHDDYSKPLDVRWLCHMCHEAHHHGEKESA